LGKELPAVTENRSKGRLLEKAGRFLSSAQHVNKRKTRTSGETSDATSQHGFFKSQDRGEVAQPLIGQWMWRKQNWTMTKRAGVSEGKKAAIREERCNFENHIDVPLVWGDRTCEGITVFLWGATAPRCHGFSKVDQHRIGKRCNRSNIKEKRQRSHFRVGNRRFVVRKCRWG